MHKVTQILLALIWLSLPMLGLAQNADPAQRGAPIAEFLDSHGRLLMPEGYSGSLDPTGYRMLTEAGQAPKFVAEATPTPAGDSGQWAAFGGLRNGCNGAILAIALMPNGNFAVGGQFSLCAEVLANNIAIYSPSSNTWSSLGTGSGNGLNSGVNALAVSGNDLYVGGFFTFAGGLPANYVARWNGSVWSSLGAGSDNGVNGPVNALEVYGGDL